jgi:cation transport regulator ChaC
MLRTRSTPNGAPASTWIFAYGSLIWRPTFPFEERTQGWIEGWTRRFWQGSTDHRGVPGAPGRVVTLVRQEGARCDGVAYRLPATGRDAILADLDHREKGGYQRHLVEVVTPACALPGALVYIATEANPEYLGPAALTAITAQIRGARGPTGSNAEYALRLAEALRALQADDAHVYAVADGLRATQSKD